MRGWIFVLTIFLISVFTMPVSAAEEHIVINSFQVAGERPTEEFIEIYNSTNNVVNLENWKLSKKSSGGSSYNLVTTFPAILINPFSSLIIAPNDSGFDADVYYSTGSSLASSNTIILSNQAKTVVDKVGYGQVVDFEGMPLPNPQDGEIYKRKELGLDNNNNFYDFEKQEEEMPTEGSDFSIYLTELLPNPKGADSEGEWIEVYNAGEKSDISGLVIADKGGSTKKFLVPRGTVMEKESYLVFYSKQSRISLNNDGDAVMIMSGGSILDETPNYGKAQEGRSFAFDGEKWVWTATITPGFQNIIQSASTDEVKKVTRKKKTSKKPKKATSKKKPRSKKGEVLGEFDEDYEEELYADEKEALSEKDRLLGYALIAVALVGGLLYTLSVNRERLIEVFNKERTGYTKAWRKLRGKVKRR